MAVVSRSRASRTRRTAASAPTALSVHIGLNSVGPKHYEGWSGDLVACEFDAKDLTALAKSAGMKPTTLLTKQATRKRVLGAIRSAASALGRGDLFLLSYSGHGGQVDDVSGEEDDKLDETWCLFDGQLIDDELYLELSRFSAGVRVLVLSDSCHSGTVTRAMPPRGEGRPRLMPPAIASRVYRAHQAFYDKLQRDVARSAGSKATVDPDEALSQIHHSNRLTSIAARCKAQVILISGCQDNQTSMDGDHNGAFTEQLLRVWNKGKFSGDYARFHAAIKARMDAGQTPNLYTMGRVAAFVRQKPFSV